MRRKRGREGRTDVRSRTPVPEVGRSWMVPPLLIVYDKFVIKTNKSVRH